MFNRYLDFNLIEIIKLRMKISMTIKTKFKQWDELAV